jgi:hypothetical protein
MPAPTTQTHRSYQLYDATWVVYPSCCPVRPYLHHRLAPVDKSPNRKLSEMTTELEAAAHEARAELEKMTAEERALVRDALPKAVY